METIKLPFYAKIALIFVAAYAFIYALYLSQQIIVPLIYALLIALLLNGVVNYLEKKKVPRTLAISIVVGLVMLFIVSLFYFAYTQFSMISDTYSVLKVKLETISLQIIQWISKYFNIRVRDIDSWVKATEKGFINDSGLMVGRTLINMGSSIAILLLLPVYLFLILYYKKLLLEFVRQLFKSTHHEAVMEVLNGSKSVIQGYLSGLLLEALVISVLNSVGLLILGIDFAIFLGITGAILNIIPYFGGIIAIAMPMIVAFVTKDSASYPLLVFGVYMLIQFIDNHFVIPYIVASKVKLNALVTIIVVLVGNALWGIPGMFLSIPLTAILKVIFDHIEPLKPWGFLMGYIVPRQTKLAIVSSKKE
jgi:predicted PurR-regulated permease PerM